MITDSYVGIRNSHFQIVVDKPWFAVSDVVIPESENYPCLVLGVDTLNTRGNTYNQYTYTLQLLTDDPNRALPSKFIDLDREWSVVSSAVATEDNPNGGGFQFFTMFDNEGLVQQFAKQYSLSDKAARRLKQWTDSGRGSTVDLDEETRGKIGVTKAVWTTIGMDSVTGTPVNKFMSLFEAELSNELYRAVDYALMFGRASQTAVSKEGHTIYTTSGLREQLEGGHTLPFSNTLELDELEAFFDYILKDRVALGEQKIVMSAGKRFRKMFDQMVKAEASQFTTIDSMFIREGIDGIRHLDRTLSTYAA